MAEYASDIWRKQDFKVATKEVKVVFSRSSEAPVSMSQANDLRAAYLQGGWSALRTAWVAIDSRAGDWLDSFTTAEREGLIYQVSSQSALPTPP